MTSRASEWYQIDPKSLLTHLGLSWCHSEPRTLFPEPVSWLGLLVTVSCSIPALDIIPNFLRIMVTQTLPNFVFPNFETPQLI